MTDTLARAAGPDADSTGRAALAGVVRAMRPGSTPGATAGAIASAVVGLGGFAGCGVFAFLSEGEVVPLAARDRRDQTVVLAGHVPTARAAYLRDRASSGPWIERWSPGLDHPHTAVGADGESRLLAYAPIRTGGALIGFLVATAVSGDDLDVAERLPGLVECAQLAAPIVGSQLRSRDAARIDVDLVRGIIAGRAFLPVFQPIVELATGVTVGYEALTRFADGSPPDRVFGEASRAGLGIELEAATLGSIVAAAVVLPRSTWLNLNVSPELLLAGEPLATIIEPWGGQLILEITAHHAISDYAAFREATRRLGPAVRLAVDDVGAGFAGLHHILELGPSYVKLDRTIVHGVHRDPARQAIVAGMAYLAGKTAMTVVAEGVERGAEARRLGQLGVTLAQGYRFGRPALADWVARPAASGEATSAAPEAGPSPESLIDGPFEEIERAINIGPVVAGALRRAGIVTIADLRLTGAIGAWERLRLSSPRTATGATLLQLEGATRGVRVSQLSTPERARLRLLARLRHRPG